MFKQTFEVEGEYRGETVRVLDLHTRAAPFSIAFFCPKCARIWARCKIEGEPWMVTTVACKNCGKLALISIPGSIWRPLDNEFNYSLPREILLEEFALHLQWYDKYRVLEETSCPIENSSPSSTSMIQAHVSLSKSNPLEGLRRL